MGWYNPWGYGYGYGYKKCVPIIQPRQNNGFILLVVLFVLLVIAGNNFQNNDVEIVD